MTTHSVPSHHHSDIPILHIPDDFTVEEQDEEFAQLPNTWQRAAYPPRVLRHMFATYRLNRTLDTADR